MTLRWKASAKAWRAKALEYEKAYGPLVECDNAAISRVLASLAAESGRKFRGKHARECVRKLMRAGFSEADIMLVNCHMSRKWKSDGKMQMYLRPSTLYCQSKFEGYLNDAINNNAPLKSDVYIGARML